MPEALAVLPGGLSLLVIKMVVTAAFVVAASLIAERASPLVAAMVATLPVSAGPVYAFLALDHDDAFIAASTLAGTYANLGALALVSAYVVAAQTRRTGPALLIGFLAYAPVVLLARWFALSAPVVGLLTTGGCLLAHSSLRPFMAARAAVVARPPWFALPLRALAVASVVGVVTSISFMVGPVWSGVLAPFPVVMSSLIVILQPRIGGPASAAVLASALLGLMGFGLGLIAAHLAVPYLGKWLGLLAGLLVSAFWNLTLTLSSMRRR